MRELEQNLDQLMRESKLCSVFLDNFIQPSDVEKIEKRAYLDKDKDIWRLKVFSLLNQFSSILAACFWNGYNAEAPCQCIRKQATYEQIFAGNGDGRTYKSKISL